MNKLVKSIPKSSLFPQFLQALNGVLDLTPRKLEVLASLIALDVSVPKTTSTHRNVICTANRKYIINTLRVTSDNLCRYILEFKASGILVPGRFKGDYVVNTALIPEVIGDRVQITIILKLKGDETKSKANEG